MNEETRLCPECEKTKPIDEFVNRKSHNGKYYRDRKCTECYRKGVADRKKKKYSTESGKSAITSSNKKYFDSPGIRKKIAEKNRDSYWSDEVRRERIKSGAREWAKNNPDRRSVYHKNRRAKKLTTRTEPITLDMLKARLAEHGGVCAYCGDPPEHWDHMTPLSRGGSHTLANLAPTCGLCNLSKGSSSYEDWLARIGVRL